MKHGKKFGVVFGLMISLRLFAEPIGLVLSGGGAKGAYEVGVWKAMVEKGVTKDVCVISGTSIGAINGALFAGLEDPAKAEDLWLERFDDLVDPLVDEVRVKLQQGFEAVADGVNLYAMYLEEGKRELSVQRGVPVTDLTPDEIAGIKKKARTRSALQAVTKQAILKLISQKAKPSRGETFRKALGESLPKDWPASAPKVYVTVLAKQEKQARAFLINELPHAQRIEAVAASNAVPYVFKPVAIDGTLYTDGGLGKNSENTPVRQIVENHPEIGTIIVVYLNNEKRLGSDRVHISDFPGTKIVEIIPSEDTYGILGSADPRKEQALKLIALGYRDALVAFEEWK